MQTHNTVSRSWKWLAIAALVGGCVSIVAAGPNDRGGNGRHAGGVVQAFDQIDRDGDGLVTRAEFDAHVAEKHAGLDANGDGVVTFDESKAFRAAQREARARARFARLDANGDGVVSTEEASARQVRKFMYLDANDDGAVSRDELPSRGGRGG